MTVYGSTTPLGGRTGTVATAGRPDGDAPMLDSPRGGARARCGGPVGPPDVVPAGERTHGARSSLPATSRAVGPGGAGRDGVSEAADAAWLVTRTRSAGCAEAGLAVLDGSVGERAAAARSVKLPAPVSGTAGRRTAAEVATRGIIGRGADEAWRGGGATQLSTDGARAPFDTAHEAGLITLPEADCDLDVFGSAPAAPAAGDSSRSSPELARTVLWSRDLTTRLGLCCAPPQLPTAAHPAATAPRLDPVPSSAPSSAPLKTPLAVLEGASPLCSASAPASKAGAASLRASTPRSRDDVERSLTCSCRGRAPIHCSRHAMDTNVPGNSCSDT